MIVRQAIVLFVAQLLFVLLVAGTALAKLVEFGGHSYVEHFTNWSWTAQILFYAGTLPAGVSPGGSRFAGAIVALAWLPLVGIVTSVWLGSRLLLLRDPDFITD